MWNDANSRENEPRLGSQQTIVASSVHFRLHDLESHPTILQDVQLLRDMYHPLQLLSETKTDAQEIRIRCAHGGHKSFPSKEQVEKMSTLECRKSDMALLDGLTAGILEYLISLVLMCSLAVKAFCIPLTGYLW